MMMTLLQTKKDFLSGMDKRDISKKCLSFDPELIRKYKSQIISSATKMQVQSVLNFSGTESDVELKGVLDLETHEKKDIVLEVYISLVPKKARWKTH